MNVWMPIVWAYAGDELAPVILQASEEQFCVMDSLASNPFEEGLEYRWVSSMEDAIEMAMDLSASEAWQAANSD